MNLVWATWEPELAAAPCRSEQQEREGRCSTVDATVDATVEATVDATVAEWSARGQVVLAFLYGVSARARAGTTGCSPVAPATGLLRAGRAGRLWSIRRDARPSPRRPPRPRAHRRPGPPRRGQPERVVRHRLRAGRGLRP